MKRNLLSVSYHIAQYTNIIADLRGEIQRLKRKIEERGGRSLDRAQLGRGDIRHIQGVCLGLREPEPVSQCPSGCSAVRQCWLQSRTRALSG